MTKFLILLLCISSLTLTAFAEDEIKVRKKVKVKMNKSYDDDESEEEVEEEVQVQQSRSKKKRRRRKSDEESSEKKRRFYLGVLKGIALNKFSETPAGFESDALDPPLGTLLFGHEADGRRFVELDLHVGLSVVDGPGQFFHVQGGPHFTWPKIQFLVGPEIFGNINGGDYDGTFLDNWGYGLVFKGMFPQKGWKPALEIRWRQILEADVGANEGTSTKIAHEDTYILKPSVEFYFMDLTLQLAYTYFQVGNTSIASRDFAIGIESNGFSMASVGLGFDFGGFDIWVKGQSIADIDDQIAYYYQAPLIYPDFLLARESLFLQGRWRF